MEGRLEALLGEPTTKTQQQYELPVIRALVICAGPLRDQGELQPLACAAAAIAGSCETELRSQPRTKAH